VKEGLIRVNPRELRDERELMRRPSRAETGRVYS